MKSPHNNFRQRLLSQDYLVGTFQKSPSMMNAEVLASTAIDVVCIDAEHSPFDRRDIDQSLLAYRAASKPSLVRVQSSTPEQILNALDSGATGVVVPHVDTPEMAREIAKAIRYGDKGRGYAGSTRAAHYTGRTIQQNLESNLNDNVVIAQIEDLAALEVIDQLVDVNGIDCLFIGMMDLTIALGCRSAKAPEVIAAGERICKAASRAKRPVGIFVSDLDDIPFWRERGVSLFLLSSEHGFIKQGVDALLTKTKTYY